MQIIKSNFQICIKTIYLKSACGHPSGWKNDKNRVKNRWKNDKNRVKNGWKNDKIFNFCFVITK